MATEGRYPDPETMAQQLLGSLFAQIEQLHRQRGDRDRFAVEPGSSLAGDDRATRPYQLSHAAVAAMGHSVEHLHAIRALIVDAGVMHPATPFTIARAAIENASVAVEADDPRPAMQMRELRTALNPLTDRPRLAAGNSNQQALHAVFRPALGASLAIETTTQSHIRAARWYTPADGGLRLTWTKIGNDHPIHEAVALVGAHARALISKIPPPQPPAPRPYQPPHEILGPALHHARPSRYSQSALPPAP